MKFFRNIPIQRKLILIILLSSVVTLLLPCATLYVFQCYNARVMITRDLMTQAEIVGANATGSISFNDSDAATAILAALKAKPHMLSACLYMPDGQLLAHFGLEEDHRDMPSAHVMDSFLYEGPHLILYQPVILQHKRIGTVFLRYDYSAMRREITKPYLSILGSIIPASLLLALLLSSVLQRIISAPILDLAATARSVAEQKNYSVRARCNGRDELGLLTSAFNHMLSRIEDDDSMLRQANQSLEKEVAERLRAQAELEGMHRRIVDVSRRAGMAEVATGVLHNVGNVLNSVNVSTTLALERLQGSKLSNLPRVAALLKENEAKLGQYLTQDPKGRQLPGYVVSLAEVVTEDQKFVLAELNVLRTHIDHIKDIVAMQQDYSKVSGVVETVRVADLVEDAIRLNTGTLSRHGVQVRKEFAPVPDITVEKPKVLQVLINLIRNAKYALDESQRPDKWITLKIAPAGEGRVQIQVIDNGVGIAPENFTRIFAHGFTTRKDGHGFGLHSGALAAQELGGSLLGRSDGLGKGAVFTLELPLQPATGDTVFLNGEPSRKAAA